VGQDKEQTVADVDVRVVERLFKTLSDNLMTVFEANRFFEEKTGLHNEAGANNLAEALSHIGTLAQEASKLTYDEQSAQVALLEDHLRRSMMEAFEKLVKARLGKLNRLWHEYMRRASALSRRGKLRGTPSDDDLRALRRSVAVELEAGRSSKTGTDWRAWKKGAEHLAKAAEASEELMEGLEQTIGAAQQYRRFQIGVALGVIGLVTGLALGLPALLA
jgi:hypothetical protein